VLPNRYLRCLGAKIYGVVNRISKLSNVALEIRCEPNRAQVVKYLLQIPLPCHAMSVTSHHGVQSHVSAVRSVPASL